MNSSPVFLPFFLREENDGEPWKKKKGGEKGEVRMIPRYKLILQLFAATYLNSSWLIFKKKNLYLHLHQN